MYSMEFSSNTNICFAIGREVIDFRVFVLRERFARWRRVSVEQRCVSCLSLPCVEYNGRSSVRYGLFFRLSVSRWWRIEHQWVSSESHLGENAWRKEGEIRDTFNDEAFFHSSDLKKKKKTEWNTRRSPSSPSSRLSTSTFARSEVIRWEHNGDEEMAREWRLSSIFICASLFVCLPFMSHAAGEWHR